MSTSHTGSELRSQKRSLTQGSLKANSYAALSKLLQPVLLLIPKQASLEFSFVSLYHCLPLVDTLRELGPSPADFSASWITCCTGTGKHDVTATHGGEIGVQGHGDCMSSVIPMRGQVLHSPVLLQGPFSRERAHACPPVLH